jgi:hypothetical protein
MSFDNNPGPRAQQYRRIAESIRTLAEGTTHRDRLLDIANDLDALADSIDEEDKA